MFLSKRLGDAVLGAAVVLIALLIAVVALGPLIRLIFGPPPGFGSDVTSMEAYVEAVLAQLLCVSLALVSFGATAGPRVIDRSWSCALSVANPVTVGLAYWVFRQVAAATWPYEYRAYHGWVVLTCLAPFALAPCVLLGAKVSRRT